LIRAALRFSGVSPDTPALARLTGPVANPDLRRDGAVGRAVREEESPTWRLLMKGWLTWSQKRERFPICLAAPQGKNQRCRLALLQPAIAADSSARSRYAVTG